MTPARKRPRGFYARLARARGVAVYAVYLELNPDKRPCVRAEHECDGSWPWGRDELERMDRAFCAAVLREIARGTERPRGPGATPAPHTRKAAVAAPHGRIFGCTKGRRNR